MSSSQPLCHCRLPSLTCGSSQEEHPEHRPWASHTCSLCDSSLLLIQTQRIHIWSVPLDNPYNTSCMAGSFRNTAHGRSNTPLQCSMATCVLKERHSLPREAIEAERQIPGRKTHGALLNPKALPLALELPEFRICELRRSISERHGSLCFGPGLPRGSAPGALGGWWGLVAPTLHPLGFPSHSPVPSAAFAPFTGWLPVSFTSLLQDPPRLQPPSRFLLSFSPWALSPTSRLIAGGENNYLSCKSAKPLRVQDNLHNRGRAP